jgi:CBS domain-containing protein
MGSTDPAFTTFHGGNAPVRTYLTADVVTIGPGASAREAAQAMSAASIGAVLVGTPHEIVALVSERDLVRAIADGLDLDMVYASDIGSTELFCIEIDDTIGDAAEEMMEDYVRHILVRDGATVVGVLSIRDVVSAYIT